MALGRSKCSNTISDLRLSLSAIRYIDGIRSKVKTVANTTGKREVIEFRDADNANIGDVIDVTMFEAGEFVDVVGTSKGKGFQGVVKRHGFAGVGESTHGQHNRLRAPGSIGACSFPARVFKGIRMAGRTGGNRVKTQNLEILKVDTEKNLLVVKGAIPGHNGSTVIIER